LNQDGDFSIETRMLKFSSNKKARYGLIFGFKDWDNYHKFTITDKGSFEIFGVYDGVSALIATSKKSKAIYTGEIGNTLKIHSIGDEFYFSINGIEVFATDGFLFRGNYFGFVANAEGGYVFESLRISEDLTERELKEVGPKVDKNEWAWSGSGFFIHPTGLIATNYHVIENSDTIEVNFFQKGVEFTFRAEIIVSDTLNDIAIIKIADSNFKPIGPIPFVFKDYTCELGTDVFALGYPDPEYMGYEIKYTDGIISSKTGFQGERNRYQTTVPIYGGNSGGPLFDKKGNLVGINTAIFEDKEAVTYAVKSNYLKLLIDSLPGSITCPDYTEIYEKPLTEKIKLISDFVPFIRVK
jgi:S1-C subfamily serine protease